MTPFDRAMRIKNKLGRAHDLHPNSAGLATLHRELQDGLVEHAAALGLTPDQVTTLGGGTEKDGG